MTTNYQDLANIYHQIAEQVSRELLGKRQPDTAVGAIAIVDTVAEIVIGQAQATADFLGVGGGVVRQITDGGEVADDTR